MESETADLPVAEETFVCRVIALFRRGHGRGIGWINRESGSRGDSPLGRVRASCRAHCELACHKRGHRPVLRSLSFGVLNITARAFQQTRFKSVGLTPGMEAPHGRFPQ